MHYLTVQDVLWIHLQIAKKQGKFSFAKLEEATNYQYAYGKSQDVVAQASRFFPGFVTMSPFESANKAVAIVAGAVFLELNGLHFSPKEKDLNKWFDRVMEPSTCREAIEGGTERMTNDHHLTCRDVANSVLTRYESPISKLAE